MQKLTRRCHSEEQRSCDVGVSRSGECLSIKREILTSRSLTAPQNDRADTSTTCIFPNRILDLRSSSFASRHKEQISYALDLSSVHSTTLRSE